MKRQDLKQLNLPDAPGVYYFLAPKTKNRIPKILYIGKATSIKDRVKSYFSKDILLTRGPKIEKMLKEAKTVGYVETDSVLEALMLEAVEIKKHRPPANSRDKDDKSYNYVVFTKEEFPRILLVRGKELERNTMIYHSVFGPFPRGGELREALKIVRKIFPFRDDKCKLGDSSRHDGARPCFNAQIGLCPGPCAGRISKKDYAKTIRNLKLFFEAKKPTLIRSLEKDMKILAKAEKFEEAEKIKKQLFALDHIQDIALIKGDLEARTNNQEPVFRIEAYDIAHTSGKEAVGVMVVVTNGELNKSQYRKFKISRDKNDDVNNLKEVLSRRLKHSEWSLPDLIVVDGGIGQINGAKEILKQTGLNIGVVSVVKDERHKVREILHSKGLTLGKVRDREILLANAEAHRFAVGYHRLLRRKGFRI